MSREMRRMRIIMVFVSLDIPSMEFDEVADENR